MKQGDGLYRRYVNKSKQKLLILYQKKKCLQSFVFKENKHFLEMDLRGIEPLSESLFPVLLLS